VSDARFNVIRGPKPPGKPRWHLTACPSACVRRMPGELRSSLLCLARWPRCRIVTCLIRGWSAGSWSAATRHGRKVGQLFADQRTYSSKSFLPLNRFCQLSLATWVPVPLLGLSGTYCWAVDPSLRSPKRRRKSPCYSRVEQCAGDCGKEISQPGFRHANRNVSNGGA